MEVSMKDSTYLLLGSFFLMLGLPCIAYYVWFRWTNRWTNRSFFSIQREFALIASTQLCFVGTVLCVIGLAEGGVAAISQALAVLGLR